MENNRILVIGDIHGCLDMLKQLLDKINWIPHKDRLIFLGDYIDRGNDSKGVVDFILSLQKFSPNIDCLMGNHEDMFMDYLSGKERGLFLMNGGWNTVESYMAEKTNESEGLVPPEHMAFFRSLKIYIELDDYYVVHAGFRPGRAIEDQTKDDMLWIRDSFIYSDYDFGKRVIFGHTPVNEPMVMENKIALDTGAAYGNKLTCLELPSMKFHCVEAGKDWSE